MTTNIIFKDRTGAIKGSINTHHHERTFIRDMTAGHLCASGVFQNFGKEGDSLTVERGLPIGAGVVPGGGKLEKLCSSQYADEESGSTVSTYHIIDEPLMWELDSLIDEGDRAGYDNLILSILDLEADYSNYGYYFRARPDGSEQNEDLSRLELPAVRRRRAKR